MEKVIVLGATGAMGRPLLEHLLERDDLEVHATSRSVQGDGRVTWHQLDAHDIASLASLLGGAAFDFIVDFMAYRTDEFQKRRDLLLRSTSQYVFLSSARVYAPLDGVLDESSPRLLDTCADEAYLATDEYALAKARQENMLASSGGLNYTIVRPSLTYNNARLQLALFELGDWLSRALVGNSVVFPEELVDITTTMTHGRDVALAISRLVKNSNALGQAFNVAGGGSLSWGEVLDVYASAFKEVAGRSLKVMRVYGVERMARELGRYDQYRFARGINRRFSNVKLESVVGGIDWTPIEAGLGECLRSTIRSGYELRPTWKVAAYLDRLSHERTSLRSFSTTKHKLGYCLARLGLV